MMLNRIVAMLLVSSISASAGWLLNNHRRTSHKTAAAAIVEPPAQAVAIPTTIQSGTDGAARSIVSLFPDGSVSIQVHQRPLQWVLREIARQGGSVEVAAAAALPATARPSTCTEAQPTEADLSKAIRDGDATARYDGLVAASSNGVPVAPDTLKTLFETDSSEPVRLLAFRQYIGALQETSTDSMQAALQAALYSPSAAIQAEARDLLVQFEESRRADAASAQTGQP